MPLHTDEPVRLVFDRFEQSIGGEASRLEACSQRADALVMERRSLDRVRTYPTRQDRALLESYLVQGVLGTNGKSCRFVIDQVGRIR